MLSHKHNHSVKMFILFTFRSSCRVWGWETSRWPSLSSCWSELSSWWIIHWDLAAQFLWTAGLGRGDDSVVESTQPSKMHLYKKIILTSIRFMIATGQDSSPFIVTPQDYICMDEIFKTIISRYLSYLKPRWGLSF